MSGPSIEEQRRRIREKNRKEDERDPKPLTKKQRKALKKKNKRVDKHMAAAFNLKYDQTKQSSKYEIAFKEIIDKWGIDYIWQQPFFNNQRYVCVDFFFPDTRIVVEIDGPEHYSKERKVKDKDRNLYLKKVHKVKDILRITNNEVMEKPELIEDLLIDKLFLKP